MMLFLGNEVAESKTWISIGSWEVSQDEAKPRIAFDASTSQSILGGNECEIYEI
jgi:hypothetical protein